MKIIEKIDPFTNETFLATRSNQVFANDQNRIKFNNLKAKEFRNKRSFVDKPLHTNIRILNELMGGKTEVELHKQFLLGKGYSFEVFTHYIEINKKQYHALYEYAIIPLANEQIKIVKK
ncbi:MAG: hypothetical protein IPH61_14430 [Bacteroidetes bacterium]|nr:hypothetical protein [Bacteroidota bacterium]MBK8680390.1 hypothetical protein [Bacteroidota bacterium]